MIRRLATAFLLSLGAVAISSIERSSGQFNGCAAGFCTPVVAGGGGAFTGVFDVSACGANCAYWGTRAASAADRGNRLMNVCNVSDVACADLSSDATTGALVITTIGGSDCSVVVCTVKTLYDRGNATVCTSYTTVCNLTQATIANRATLVVSCGGTGKPCLACNGATPQHLDNTTISAFNQPFSVSAVADRTGNTSAYSDIVGFNGNVQNIFNNSVNQYILYAGTLSAPVAGNDNTVHAIQGMYNGVSSTLRVDATSSTVNPGANAIGTAVYFCAADGSFANPLTGNVFEIAMWGQNVSANFAALYTNQKAYWSGIP